MAAARPIHTSYTLEAEPGVNTVVRADGQTTGYVNMGVYQSVH